MAAPPPPPPPAPVSVYRVSPSWDAAIIGTTALANLWPALNASNLIHPRCPCDPSEVNGLDRGAIGNDNAFADTLSDVTVGAALLAPPVLDAMDVGFGHAFAEDMTVYAETISVTGALVTLAKYTVQRPLPRVYAGQAPELISRPGGYRSFYSGHVTLTFSALTASSLTISLRHGSGAWPWIATGVIGASVAAERVAAGRHFYTDVALGAVTGGAVGFLVPWWHARHGREPMPFSIAPRDGGVLLSWSRSL